MTHKPWPLTGPLARLDVDALLRAGSIEGPYRRTRPMTVSLWRRLVRLMRGVAIRGLKS